MYERKWEVDSLASFLGFSYQYWTTTGDDSFVNTSLWTDAVEKVIKTIHEQQEPTFDEKTGTEKNMEQHSGMYLSLCPAGIPLKPYYLFSQQTDRPTETQFLSGRGNPVLRTGLVKSLFRPSDDATIFPFFIPGNAMLSVELDHLSQLLYATSSSGGQKDRLLSLAAESKRLSKEIRDAIYRYGVVDLPDNTKAFACKQPEDSIGHESG